MTEITNLRKQLATLEAEIAEIKAMPEAMVCERYHCDSASEILDIIIEDELNPILKAIEVYEEELNEVESYWGDPAFPTEQSYYNYIGVI